MKLTRRQWLRLAGYSGALGVGLYTWRVEPHWIEVIKRPLTLAGLDSRWHGKTLVQISDLHFGPIVSTSYLRAALQKVEELQPDAIVVTGDWLDVRWSAGDGEAEELFALIPKAPKGVVGILGNHDYGKNYTQLDRADLVEKSAEILGVRLLRNESFVWDGLPVVGLDDLWGYRGNYSKVLKPMDRDLGHLILCHNPDGADLSLMGAMKGWILAGHTHGGQIRLPGYGAVMVPVHNTNYVAGHFEIVPGLEMWINRGLGYNLPFRFCSRPEITVFELEAG